MSGDGGGSYQLIRDNVLVNPGQVGIGVASGTNIRVLSNQVFSSRHSWSNTGIYAWNQYAGSCGSIEIRDNHVDWTNASGQPSAWWNGKNCGTIAGIETNNWNADLGTGIY